MKTVILCGGMGKRLNQETEYRPKPLVEIGGKPILWHIMKIYSHQDFKDFILCLGYKGNMVKEYFLNLKEMSNDFVLDLKEKKISHLDEDNCLDGNVYFIDTGLKSMTGARIAKIKKFIGEDEDFFLTYGDGVSDVDLKKLYEYHKKMGKVATITTVNPAYRFGLVEIGEGMIQKFDEKPKMNELPGGGFINGGFMVFNKKIFDYLSEDEDCILEEEPLRKLATEGQLAAYQHDGFWKCLDTQKDADELNKVHKEGAPWMLWKDG
tara:strand:+ start:587 stop:1381 length:795 start_codon:yes stop_codon:yes gene_type:complete